MKGGVQTAEIPRKIEFVAEGAVFPKDPIRSELKGKQLLRFGPNPDIFGIQPDIVSNFEYMRSPAVPLVILFLVPFFQPESRFRIFPSLLEVRDPVID
jgi:hypothetical protein